jgi:tetratricopeptide (TPR) repeat protein
MKFIANLNGTILCPYQILLDISEQIPNSDSRIKNLAFSPICDLDSTNDWINLESLGKPVAIRAKAICDAISTLMKKQHIETFSLEVYISGTQLASDNLFGLLYLAQAFNTFNLTFFTTTKNLSSLQASIEPLMAEKQVSVHFNTEPGLLAENQLNQLEKSRWHTINTLGFTFDEHFLNKKEIPESLIHQIIGFSWMCLKSGGYEIACELLEKTKNHSSISSAMDEQLFMHLLMIRFFSHQYALIATSAFPEQFLFLEASEVRTLHFLTAYSATLSRNLDVAQRFFTKCGINEDMPLSDETSLYQLNLFALSRVLKGETETAFKLEFRIESYIAQQKIETVGLKYVNFINIARLYKKIKDFDLSLEYYNKAYNEISGGGYTTSDHIYYNMNLGSLNEAAGNHEKALSYWVKTAIHWLACKNKYELSWRPRLILCQETLSDISNPLPIDKANIFLLNKIKELIQLCDLQLVDKMPTHHFIDDNSALRKEQCFIHKNILLYTAQINSVPVSHHNSQELSGLVAQFLHTVMDLPENQNVLIIDTQRDTAFINDAEVASAVAHLAQCTSCYFNGQWLKGDDFKSIKSMTASLSKVIQSIAQTDKGLTIRYKRSFLNKTLLDEEEIALVNQLKLTNNLSLQDMPETRLNLIHKLAKKRIVNFAYPE